MRRGIPAAARSAAAGHFRFLIADKGLSVTSVHCCKHEGKKKSRYLAYFFRPTAPREGRGCGGRPPWHGVLGGARQRHLTAARDVAVHLPDVEFARARVRWCPPASSRCEARAALAWLGNDRPAGSGRAMGKVTSTGQEPHLENHPPEPAPRGGCLPPLPPFSLTRPCCSTPVDNYKLDV